MAAAAPDPSTRSEARLAAQEYLRGRLASSGRTGAARPFLVPAIDIAPSFSPSLADRQAVAAQIRDACTNSGFFHITGHGVSAAARQGILAAARRFTHDLAPARKEALHVRHSPYLRGYEPAEFTSVNPADRGDDAAETKECFNWGYEPGLDPTGGDGRYCELDGARGVTANVWPAEADLPGFYAAVRQYYAAVLQLARHLCRLFALSLDLAEDYFDRLTTHPGGIARLLYYPPATEPRRALDPTRPEREIGLGAHSDYECFTILLCSAAAGLEILSPDDRWVAAPAVEDGFVVNVADFLMRWTNGVYKSTVHRVVNRSAEARYSVPLFFSINYDETVEVLPSCITPENPAQYPPIRAGEYILERLRASLKEE